MKSLQRRLTELEQATRGELRVVVLFDGEPDPFENDPDVIRVVLRWPDDNAGLGQVDTVDQGVNDGR